MTSQVSLVNLAASAGLDNLPSSFLMIVARRLIAASASSSQTDVKATADDLGELFGQLWSRLSPQGRSAIRNHEFDVSGLKEIFTAGQMSFANAVAAQMSELRESDDFREAVLGKKYAHYISALAANDLIGTQLANIVNVAEETVSRRLSELREFGLTDFRRDGRNIVNFLTPAARSVYETRLQLKNTLAVEIDSRTAASSSRFKLAELGFSLEKKIAIGNATSSLDSYMRHVPHVVQQSIDCHV